MQDEVYRDFIRYGCSCINRIVGFGMDNLWDDYLDKHCERKHRIQYRQIGTVSTCRNAVGICKAMIESGINPDNITECIKFEYNLVQRGYDLKKLIEMIEKHKQQFQIGTVEECRKSVEICKSMIGRNITPENMEEYMKFDD